MGKIDYKYYWIMNAFLIVIVSLIPLLELWNTRTVYSGADMQFHVNRIQELAYQIRSGNFSLISVNTFNSVGSGVQYFYPNLTLIPAVIINLIIKNSVDAYYFSLLIYGVITYFVSYYSFSKIINDKLLAILGTVIFSLSYYRVFSIVGVSAFGEFIAIAWIPLIILGYYRVITEKKWKTLWIAMVLMGYTHLLSLVIATVLLIFITVIRAMLDYKQILGEFVCYIKAAVSFLVSFLAFLVPFLQLTKLNSIFTPDATLHYDWAHTFAGYYISSLHLLLDRTLGFVFIILLIGMFFLWKYLKLNTRLLYIFGLVVLFISSSDFPWVTLVNTPIANLQFPYRIVPFSVGIIVLSSMMAIRDYSIYKSNLKRKNIVIILLVIITVCTTLLSLHRYKSTMDSNYKVEINKEGHLNYRPFAQYRVTDQTFNKQFNNSFDTYGAFDYWTKNALKNKESITNHIVLDKNGKFIFSRTSLNNSTVKFTINNSKDQRIDLPFIQYDGIPYEVTVDGKKVAITNSKRGTISVIANRGTKMIIVKPKIKKIFIIYWVISLVFSIILLFIPYGRFKK